MSIILEQKSYDVLMRMRDSQGEFYHGRLCRCGCSKLLKEFSEKQLFTIQYFLKKGDIKVTHTTKKDELLGIVKYVIIQHEYMKHFPQRTGGII